MKNNQIINSLINCFMSVGCFICVYVFHGFKRNKNDNTLIIAAFFGVFINLIDVDFMYKISFAISSCILLLNPMGIYYSPAGAIVPIPLIAGNGIEGLGYMYIIYLTLTSITIIYSFSILKKKFKKIIYYGK